MYKSRQQKIKQAIKNRDFWPLVIQRVDLVRRELLKNKKSKILSKILDQVVRDLTFTQIEYQLTKKKQN